MFKEAPPIEIRFLNNFIKGSENVCWLWKGAKTHNKYGSIWFNGRFKGRRKSILAHRYSWIFFNKKKIPKGKVICHSCDTPLCINPKHLILGTQVDNMKDMWRKGRGVPTNAPRGEKQWYSKLTEKNVLKIRKWYSEKKFSFNEMAKIFKVHSDTIYYVCIRKSWKWL